MNFRTRIKICGITNSNNAKDAVAAGADALGFIFAKKSPRLVEPEHVRDIVNGIPPFVDTVGVFVNESEEEIIKNWTKKSSTIGKSVIIKTNDGDLKGKAIKIDLDGSLILKQKDKTNLRLVCRIKTNETAQTNNLSV